MASSLPTLIKLAKSKVENIQKILADLHRGVEAIDQKLVQLKTDTQRGGELAAKSNDLGMLAQSATFMQRAIQVEAKLKKERLVVLKMIDEQKAVLATHFAEQKRYETLHQRVQDKARRERLAKQQAQLDEAANGWADTHP